MHTKKTNNYLLQTKSWPQTGKHIMAHYDEDTIIVYQAYRPEIGISASIKNLFDGAFSYNRMSWIKPNFLWMMYRSGWGTKSGQETTLAITLRRQFFDDIYSKAIASSYHASGFDSIESWKHAIATSEVRLQWDPDHGPNGASLERRAVQLGLRGETLRRYGNEEALDIEDISEFVAEQRQHLKDLDKLETPIESVYKPFTQTLKI